jgi:predicted metal-binding membrane protein
MTHVHGDTGLLALTTMWLSMMTLMMAPAAWPWVRAFHRFGIERGGRAARIGSTLSFSIGYVAAWAGYSLIAGVTQFLLLRGTHHAASGTMATVSAAILVGAGLYQFAPQKRACLTHCRNPLTYFLARWRNGPRAGFRLGFGHGLFCVGCCWALMATSLLVGVSHLLWMAALTGVVFVE